MFDLKMLLSQFSGFKKFTLLFIGVVGIVTTLSIFGAIRSNASQKNTETSSYGLYDDIGLRLENIDSLSSREQRDLRNEAKIHCAVTGRFCHEDPKTVLKDDFQRSYLHSITSIISYPLMNLPASGIKTMYSSIRNAGFIPEAHAAGFGFDVLVPFQNLWKQVRNVAFTIMGIVIIFEAISIVFKSNLGSKESVSVETYIPKIVAAMILIQMSYAIVGFMIDLMYIIVFLIYLMLAPSIGGFSRLPYADFMNQYLFGNPENLIGLLQSAVTIDPTAAFTLGSIQQIFNSIWQIPTDLIYMFGTGYGFIITLFIDIYVLNGVLSFAGPLLAKLAASPLGIALGVVGITFGLAQFTLAIIFLFGILYIAWKLFMLMLKTYVTIIILTVLSPLIILASLLPGNSIGIQAWFKSIVSELVVYPVVFGVIFLLLAMKQSFSNLGASTVSLPFVPEASAGLVFLIGITGIALIPKFVEGIRALIARSLFSGLEESLLATGRGVTRLTRDVVGSTGRAMGAQMKNVDGKDVSVWGEAGRRIRGRWFSGSGGSGHRVAR